MNDDLWPWLSVSVSVLILAGYELRLARSARRDPGSTARSAHLHLRAQWVQSLSKKQGMEIIAVQALRNSLMSATINASTAALTLMGTISITAAHGGLPQERTVHVVLVALLLLTLFATYVCAALSMRFYQHAGFALSLPIGSAERESQLPLAVAYVQRGGLLYGWSLHFFLFAAPVVVGLISPLAMPFAALGLLQVLLFFDRAPKPIDA